jgi:hypothetical protein
MPVDITITTVAHLIQTSVAPVFLLTGVGSMLGVLTHRLARVVDRARYLEGQLPAAAEQLAAAIHVELNRLSARAHLINWSITLCILCALLVCSLIAAMFIGDMINTNLASFLALLFIAAMFTLIGGLLCFLREIYITIQNLRIGLH